MALTLDATLATAQDSISRMPLVEITSSPTVADIPFDGTFFTGESTNEFQPFIINHSSGVSLLVYCTTASMIYAYTNPEGTQFTSLALPAESGTWGVSCAEMPSGNIAIVYFRTNGANFELRQRIITPAGVPVSNALIATWAATVATSHAWLIYDPVNVRYNLFYAKQSSSNYYIYKRTSTNFSTWTAESAITLTGLLTTRKTSSPSIMQLANGDWWLFFDYVSTIAGTVEVSNIYYIVSSDQGTTWGAPVAFTSNTSINETYKHPVGLQKTGAELIVAYTKEQAILKLDNNDSSIVVVKNIDYNAATNKLYIYDVYYPVADSNCLVEIDCTSWSETNRWDRATIPSVHTSVRGPNWSSGMVSGSGRWHPLSDQWQMSVIDSDNDTIKHYHFVDNATYGVTANISYAGQTPYLNIDSKPVVKIRGVRVDPATDRMWIMLLDDYGLHNYLHWGYIDLNEVGPGYTFTIVHKSDGTFDRMETTTCYMFGISFLDGLVYMSGRYSSVIAPGRLLVFDINGGLYRQFVGGGEDSQYPFDGPNSAYLYDNGCIYMGFPYRADNGQAERRGLCKIELANSSISYFRPTYSELDDYKFNCIVKGPENTLLISSDYGLAIFDTVDFSWQLRSLTDTPQLYRNAFTSLVYDPDHEMIYANNGGSVWETGIVGLPVQGILKTSYYYSGLPSGGSWEFTSQGKLVQGINDYDAVLTMSPPNPNVMIAFWENKKTSGKLSLKWDTEIPPFDLSPYLVSEAEITLERDITNAPNRLAFTCSHGHLFDPHNRKSLLSNLLRKGRKIIIRWGERISGVDFWQNAGTFNVLEARTSYQKGIYTDIKVVCEDQRTIWGDKHIYATDYYQAFPEAVLADLLEQNAGLSAGQISIPNIVGRAQLDHQWIDTTLAEVVEQICNRFGYYGTMDANGNFTLRRISNTATVDHVYPDTTKIISFTPEDKYSDFTNRVTIQGQSRDFIEVIYPEERVGQMSGTVGWWGYKNDFTVRYSEDESRRCINPRLQIIESTTSLGFAISRISIFSGFSGEDMTESISYEDPNQKYCVVTVEAPDMTAALAETAIGTIASLYIPDGVVSVGGGQTIRIGSALTGIGMLGMSTILGSTGNYQYEIYAQPLGKVRRSLQASANDTTHQADIGNVIEKKVEDPLCYTQSDCQLVADFELMVASLQRSRVKLTKIAHLQDQEGDTIQIPHPYTGDTLKLLIVALNRSYKKATGPDSDGYFLDEIEGWVL